MRGSGRMDRSMEPAQQWLQMAHASLAPGNAARGMEKG